MRQSFGATRLGTHQSQLSLIRIRPNHFLGPGTRCSHSKPRGAPVVDHRVRLSGIWAPSGGITESKDSHSRLIRAGFLRQAQPGIFHILPLGRRVQDKLEALINKYMSKLGASKLDLSSISSESVWEKSGRLKSTGSELFRFKDRNESKLLLSPTHEEEITTLVSGAVHSYKDLPLRVYQISRKYRDELRPRHGLLRSREFVMKDLYTFDSTTSQALSTYNEVKEMYARLFDELKMPYLVAEADSGNMGGNLSHEFHFPTSKGDDLVISCGNCDYVANEELATSPITGPLQPNGVDSLTGTAPPTNVEAGLASSVGLWQGISRDRSVLVNVWHMSPPLSTIESNSPKGVHVNIHAIKAVFPELDSSIEDPIPLWYENALSATSTPVAEGSPSRPPQILNMVDGRVPEAVAKNLQSMPSTLSVGGDLEFVTEEIIKVDPVTGKALNLQRIQDGDICPRCSKDTLKVQKAIELGHTFHLGTRYSEPLEAKVQVPTRILREEGDGSELVAETTKSGSHRMTAMQMGCHGIGVTRIIGAVADTLADKKGLNWPRVMAPFELVVISTDAEGQDKAAVEVYDVLAKYSATTSGMLRDHVLDDRQVSFPWKIRDADLVGYPIIVVIGKRWNKGRWCEVQCRRLDICKDVHVDNLGKYVQSLLSRL